MRIYFLKSNLKLAFILTIAIFLSDTLNSQTQATNEHVKELLTLSGSGKIGVQVMSNMMATYKKQMPSVPEKFWDEMMKEMNADELINLVIPIYAKYFSDEEILQLIGFYKSPIGIKLTEKLPLITQDSYAAGAVWGKQISDEVVEKLKNEGYLKDSGN